MWWLDIETILYGIIFTAVIFGIILLVVVIGKNAGNGAAKKFKENNPNAATIWIVGERFFSVKIKKVDGETAKTHKMGVVSDLGGTYILPGNHVLSLEHCHADPAVNKNPEYKKQRCSEMNVSLEPGKDYILQFNEHPDQYSLIEGKPEGM